MSPEIDNHLTANTKMKRKDIMIGNFLGGLSWGFGTVIGATIVVAILVGVLRTAKFTPYIGNVFGGLLDTVEQKDISPLQKQLK